MSNNRPLLITMCASLLAGLAFQSDAHAYENTFGTLQLDRCAIFDETVDPYIYGSGHPKVDFFVPDRSKGSPSPDVWTGDTISVSGTGTPTYHKVIWVETYGISPMGFTRSWLLLGPTVSL